jgi:hypothetical protein
MVEAASVVLVVGTGASAAVIRVPEDYPSVLAGADAASGGDSVLVGPGTWTDRAARTVVVLGTPQTLLAAMFLKPGVCVIGTSGAEDTVLDGGPLGAWPVYSVIHVLPGSESAKVVGMTVTGGGAGILAARASPLEVTACRVERNQKWGILSREQSLTLTSCSISENELGGDPVTALGGVAGFDLNVTCDGCTFQGNVGPGLHVERSSDNWPMTVILRDCSFLDIAKGSRLTDVAQ